MTIEDEKIERSNFLRIAATKEEMTILFETPEKENWIYDFIVQSGQTLAYVETKTRYITDTTYKTIILSGYKYNEIVKKLIKYKSRFPNLKAYFFAFCQKSNCWLVFDIEGLHFVSHRETEKSHYDLTRTATTLVEFPISTAIEKIYEGN